MQYVNESETHSVSWAYLLHLLRRYYLLVLATFVLTVLTGWGVLNVFFNDLYESKAVLLVKIGRETSEMPTTLVNGSLLSQGVRIQDINSEVQMLSSESLVADAVDKIGPDSYKSLLPTPTSIFGYPKYYLKMTARYFKSLYKEALIGLNLKKRLEWREEVITGVIEAVKVEPVKESDVLVLKVRLPSAELAMRTAQEILAGYLRLRAEVRRNSAARDYYTDRAKHYRGQMMGIGEERAKVRENYSVSSPGEQRSLLLKQLSDLEVERVDVEASLRKLLQEQQEINQKLASMPVTLTKEETYMRNPTLQSLKERITNLQMERAKLLGRYNAGSELVNQLDVEIRELENSLKKESQTVLAATVSEQNPLRQEFLKGLEERRVEIAGLNSRLRKLEEPIGQIRQKLADLNVAMDAVERVERDYRVAEQSYLAYYKRMSDSQMSEEMDNKNIANVSVVNPPSLPLEPIYPRKLFIMGILLPVGLLLGMGISALLESMNDRIRDEQDMALIPDLPLLGIVEADWKEGWKELESPERRRIT
ncbi:MAG: GNVR domain-containing protein [Bryobacter sp.]|nr:GNVR domain-containing protein [Bryobacter sp.]